MSAEAELREVQRKHGGIKKLIAGEIRLGNVKKAEELEKEFRKLTDKMRELEGRVQAEEKEAKETAAKVSKQAAAKRQDRKAAENEYEKLMSNVRDVDAAIADVRTAMKGEKDSSKRDKLMSEEGKLKRLWSKLVKAAADARKSMK